MSYEIFFFIQAKDSYCFQINVKNKSNKNTTSLIYILHGNKIIFYDIYFT